LTFKNVPKEASFVEYTVKNFLQKYPVNNGFKITTNTDFSSKFGLGSSSAITVCTAKALSELFNLNLNNEELFEVCYKTVLDVQGKGSGFDLAAAIWGGTLLFQNKGKIVQPLDLANFDLVVAWTGQKYETVKVLKEVDNLAKEFPDIVYRVYDNITYLVNKVIEISKNKNLDLLLKLGKYMNFNQAQLYTLGVSSLELEAIIQTSLKAGAFGAKLSGAGKGDCAIALVNSSNKNQVQEAIKNIGFEVINVKIGAKGVMVI
jgi:mevalonate kinase